MKLLRLSICVVCLVFRDLVSAESQRSLESSCEDSDAIWCDEFNSFDSPREKYWDYELGNGVDGWGNNEIQNYTKANAKIMNGMLHISALREDTGNPENPYSYSSARIKTQGKVKFHYVRLEARIKTPKLDGGLWPAFWLLGSNFPEIGWPACGEIDIAEWGSQKSIEEGVLNAQVSSAAHWLFEEFQATEENSLNSTTALSNDFHIYSMDWTPTYIKTYLDGNLIFELEITSLQAFQKPHFVLLNVAVGGRYTGIETPNTMGGDLIVDWIRAYDNGYADSPVTVEPCEDCSDEEADEDEASSSSMFQQGLLISLVSAFHSAAVLLL